MPNHYYETTAVLRLKHLTPLIMAIFGPLSPVAKPSEGDEVLIAVHMDPEGTDASWDTIKNALLSVAQRRGVDISEALLIKLAAKWNVEIQAGPQHCVKALLLALADNLNRVAWPGFLAFLDDIDEEDDAPITTRVRLAQMLDDGHGLIGFSRTACWYSSKPVALSGGGAAEVVGPNFTFLWDSDKALEFGQEMERLLAEDYANEAGQLLANQVNTVLKGIAPPHRAEVQELLSKYAFQGTNSYFAVWGRLPDRDDEDDDEDSFELVEAATRSEAESKFADALWLSKYPDPEKRTQVRNSSKLQHGVDVFTSLVLRSSTPITFE